MTRTSSSGRRTKYTAQSNAAPIHLCGLTTMESAASTPCHNPAALRQDHRRSGHGGIDVQPQAVRAPRWRDGFDRIDRRGRGRAGRRDDRARPLAGRQVGGNRAAERVRLACAQAASSRDLAGDCRGRIRRGAAAFSTELWLCADRVHDERRRFGLQAAAAKLYLGRAFARAEQGHQRAGRRRVLNHAAPGVGQTRASGAASRSRLLRSR